MVAAMQSDVLLGPTSKWDWTGPSQPLQNIALAVMGLGHILPITSPAPNASWRLDFWGPALQCDDVLTDQRDSIWTNIWNSYNGTTTGPYGFLSWVPWSYADTQSYLDSPASSIDPDLPFILNLSDRTIGPSPSSLSTGGPASFFIAVIPEAQNLSLGAEPGEMRISYNGSVPADCLYQQVTTVYDPIISDCTLGNLSFTPAIVYNDSTLLRCDLVITSYSVDFVSSSGTMNLHIFPNMTGQSPIIDASNYFVTPGPHRVPNGSEPRSCSSSQTHRISDIEDTPCVFNVDSVRLLSYQGIMAAFNQLVLGATQLQGSPVGFDTTIMRTILAETTELEFIRNWSPGGLMKYADLESSISGTAGLDYPGLMNLNLPNRRGDLKSNLEKLFQNFTMSILSEPYFQPNYSSPFAPSNSTNVSLPTHKNVYTYDRATLWIAYGISLLFTTLAVFAGMISLVLSGASYSHDFSTIIRVGRKANLNIEVLDRDGLGADPLPTYLKHARFDMGARSTMMANDEHEMTKTPPEEQKLVIGHEDPLSMD